MFIHNATTIRSVFDGKFAVVFVLCDHIATKTAQVMLIAHIDCPFVTVTRGNAYKLQLVHRRPGQISPGATGIVTALEPLHA